MNSTLGGEETTDKDGNIDPKRPRKATPAESTNVVGEMADNNRNDVSAEAHTTEMTKTGDSTRSSQGNNIEMSNVGESGDRKNLGYR